MSYQALARKWRPGVFAEVVGQEHVVRALSNALDRNQVHHAFLFSGTRGVGKTTLARIFAKALNCEAGVSSSPCNACGACQAIDRANFVDLIEVDAASRTKVDDTRELLDNVQYAPTTGRYKVYLIDEVHMLSGHSFNALLKTLEEPPPHVKFLLATTDPQKLPVTVLSRCLQFHLKALQPDQIRNQLRTILEAEQAEYDEGALDLLARAADGSLRDGLSLLDQAIAFGAGSLREPLVRDMLGTIEDDVVESLLRALAGGDASELLAVVAAMAERACDYTQALDGILTELFNLSLYHAAVDVLRARQAERPWYAELSSALGEEDIQLYYQIGLIGKRDLALAPDPRTGFEMVMLRMLAFRPARSGLGSTPTAPASAQGEAGRTAAGPGRSGSGQDLPAARETRTAERNAGGGAQAADRSPPRTQASPESTTWRELVERMPINGGREGTRDESGLEQAFRKLLSSAPRPRSRISPRRRPGRRHHRRAAADGAGGDTVGGDRSARYRDPRTLRRAGERGEKAGRRAGHFQGSQRKGPGGTAGRNPGQGFHKSQRTHEVDMKGGLGNLMKQAQAMQDNLRKAQEELARTEVEGQSGGGMVKVTMTCRHDIRKVEIEDSIVNSEDKEVLEDLIAAAVNDAVRKVEQATQEKMAGLTGGLNIPGLNLPM